MAPTTTRRAKIPTSARSTEENRPASLDPENLTPAMARLCGLRAISDYFSDVDSQWRELLAIAYLEGHKVNQLAWASGRPKQTARVYRVIKGADIDDTKAIPPVQAPEDGLAVPEDLQHFPDTCEIDSVIRRDPGRLMVMPEIERPPLAILSTPENKPRRTVVTPVMERMYTVSELRNTLADLAIGSQVKELVAIADGENNSAEAIAWAVGIPEQRSRIYTMLPNREARTHRYQLDPDERKTITPLPVPGHLLRLPGLANVAALLHP